MYDMRQYSGICHGIPCYVAESLQSKAEFLLFTSEFCTRNSSVKTVLTFCASSITRRVDLVCEQLVEVHTQRM
jgi:hypothetical protein